MWAFGAGDQLVREATGVCLQAQRSSPCQTSAPGEARQFCREHLGPVLGQQSAGLDLLSTTELVVTELVTNALNAASTGMIAVDLTLHRTCLRISVQDDACGRPQVKQPTSTSEHGRGLFIIELIATAWGSAPVHGGKQVWVELAVPALVAAALDCALPARQ